MTLRARGSSISSRVTRWWVTCTVVSVMPYMLTRAGDSSPCRSSQGRRCAGSRASPPNTTYRRASGPSSSPASWSAWTSCWKAEGVWLRTVTPSRRSSRRKSRGERLVSYGTTTSRPPCSSGPQNSQTEKSKAYEWKSVHTSSGPKAKCAADVSKSRTTLECGMTTPLGRPVEPEVWMMYAGSPGVSGAGRSASVRSVSGRAARSRSTAGSPTATAAAPVSGSVAAVAASVTSSAGEASAATARMRSAG